MIKTLKQQITEMQSRTAEIAALKKDLAKVEKENARLVAENGKASESLAAAHKEKETLSTKLAAARSTAPSETKNVPGSAVKARSTGVVLPGQIEAAKKAQFQEQKVDLYSDLTNLLVMGVKKSEEGDDVYDCIQTGRNGSELLPCVEPGTNADSM
jgi:septal ring factor EnvC (AmiA/AmiB activator)